MRWHVRAWEGLIAGMMFDRDGGGTSRVIGPIANALFVDQWFKWRIVDENQNLSIFPVEWSKILRFVIPDVSGLYQYEQNLAWQRNLRKRSW